MKYDENGNFLREMTFTDILGSLLYDWSSSLNPSEQQLRREESTYFSLHKTSIISDENGINLYYKTECDPVSQDAYDKLVYFYENFYKDDYFFDIFISLMSDTYSDLSDHNLKESTNDKIVFFNNQIIVEKYKNTYLMHSKDYVQEIDEKVFDKIKRFKIMLDNEPQ